MYTCMLRQKVINKYLMCRYRYGMGTRMVRYTFLFSSSFEFFGNIHILTWSNWIFLVKVRKDLGNKKMSFYISD